MKRLYIQFTRPAGGFTPFSWAIRTVQRTDFSHVRFFWENSVGVPVVYEASGSSVKFLGPHAQENKPTNIIDMFYIDLTPEQYRKLVRICMTYAGVEYGTGQILNITLSMITGCKQERDGAATMVCSEIAARILVALGHDLQADFDYITPKELYEWCCANL